MPSYGLIITVLGVCVSGSTAAVHTGDAGSSRRFEPHLKLFFVQ